MKKIIFFLFYILCFCTVVSAETFVFEGFTFSTIMGNRLELTTPESGYSNEYADLALNGKIIVPEKVYYKINSIAYEWSSFGQINRF